jgi:hypothetical protein
MDKISMKAAHQKRFSKRGARGKTAFDDVQCPFDYKAELNKARDALDDKVRECARLENGLERIGEAVQLCRPELFAR